MQRICHLRQFQTLATARQSALSERFQQMLEDKLDQPQQKSIIDENPKLKELYDKYSSESQKDSEFKRQHLAQMALLERENLLNGNRHAKYIADTVTKFAWNGSESPLDAHNRMILDLMPPPKPVNNHNRIMSPPKDPKTRMVNAREGSLDYKTGARSEEDNFRELYKERLLGPSMLINSNSPTATMGLAQTMADVRINSTINRKTGKFDSPLMDSVRGKPLDPKHLANATDTNYFVNQILSNQDVLPPWIESQQTLEREIKLFREDLDNLWTKNMLSQLNPGSNSKLDVLARARPLSKSAYDNLFASKQMPYVNEKIKHINSFIRNYNLMCPSPHLHKFKLVPDLEIRNLFKRSMENLEQSVEAWYEREARAREVRARMNSSRSMFLLFDTAGKSSGPSSSGSSPSSSTQSQPLHFWKSIKEMMRS